jgi:hypothetical protein
MKDLIQGFSRGDLAVGSKQAFEIVVPLDDSKIRIGCTEERKGGRQHGEDAGEQVVELADLANRDTFLSRAHNCLSRVDRGGGYM